MSKKELNVYYKGAKQKIKYYGNLVESQIKSTVKQIFKIKEPLEQIFFQDEDGDIIVLNDQIPSGLPIHIFVEPDLYPENPSKELNIKEKVGLIKFHWIPEKNFGGTVNYNINNIFNKYLYTTVNDDDAHPPARSSCTFEKGIHFFVLRKPVLTFYSLLLITEESVIPQEFGTEPSPKEIGILNGYPEEQRGSNDELFAINLGILIDMEKKKCIFYDYDKKTKRKIIYMSNNKKMEGYEAPIDFQKAKLFAWIKRDVQNRGKTGITILNEGCIPIPQWVKNSYNFQDDSCIII